MNLCQRLLANIGLPSEGYEDTVRKLREKGLLDENEERFINSVIGFRNITVHEYMTVDVDVVGKILEKREYRKILEITLKLKERAGKYWDP
nr:DUF86 domain-containing protein [Candidatus Acidianus copahuensis]